MLSEKVGRAAFVPFCLALVVPVFAFLANFMPTDRRDGWFIKMILEHDAVFVSLSVPVMTLVLFYLSYMAREDEPESVVQLAAVVGFFLTLAAGIVQLLDDRQFQLGRAGQHYWLITIFALQTLLPMIALLWVTKKLEKHRQPEPPPTK